jgi:hypothetical protein
MRRNVLLLLLILQLPPSYTQDSWGCGPASQGCVQVQYMLVLQAVHAVFGHCGLCLLQHQRRLLLRKHQAAASVTTLMPETCCTGTLPAPLSAVFHSPGRRYRQDTAAAKQQQQDATPLPEPPSVQSPQSGTRMTLQLPLPVASMAPPGALIAEHFRTAFCKHWLLCQCHMHFLAVGVVLFSYAELSVVYKCMQTFLLHPKKPMQLHKPCFRNG